MCPAWLILSSRLPWPSRTASIVTVYAVHDQEEEVYHEPSEWVEHPGAVADQ